MKRKSGSCSGGGDRKKARHADPVNQSDTATTSGPDHPVLQRLYPQVVTLRQYLLSQLPKSSKNRRRNIAQIRVTAPAEIDASTNDADTGLAQLLDSVLVGLPSAIGYNTSPQADAVKERDREIECFTQQRSQNTSGGTFKPGYFMQYEVSTVAQSPFHEGARGDISKSGN